MPVGAYGGKKEIMECVSPAGPVYQAGTLSGNPLAMAAGLAMLKYINDNPPVYEHLEAVSDSIARGMESHMREAGLNYVINRVGSMLTLFFADTEVVDFASAKRADTSLFGKYFQRMLGQGVYLPPSQFEAMFISTSIDQDIVDRILTAHGQAIRTL